MSPKNSEFVGSDFPMPSSPRGQDFQRIANALIGDQPWSWSYRFNPALKEHVHALGVIAVNYNDLEAALFLLIFNYLGLNSGVPQIIFQNLNNNSRLDVLEAMRDAHESDLIVKDLLNHFIAAYAICTDNRNFLMHAKAHNAAADVVMVDHLVLKKSPRNDPTKTNYTHLRIDDLRRIADEMSDYSMFGIQICLWLAARKTGGRFVFPSGVQTPALPDKPPLPIKLTLSADPAYSNAPPSLDGRTTKG